VRRLAIIFSTTGAPGNKTTASLHRGCGPLFLVEIFLIISALAEIASSKTLVSEKAPWHLQSPVAVSDLIGQLLMLSIVGRPKC
jgi:hypothetical protein